MDQTTAEIRDRQQALQQRLRRLEAELARLAGPANGEALAWFLPLTEQVRDARRRLPWT